jgi:hypothetical protein
MRQVERLDKVLSNMQLIGVAPIYSRFRNLYPKIPMNSQPNSDWERQPQEVKVEIDPEPAPTSVNSTNASEELENAVKRIKIWFNSLPPAGRLIVTLIAVTLAFSLLSTVLKIVMALLSTAVLVVVLYLVYKYAIASRSPNP